MLAGTSYRGTREIKMTYFKHESAYVDDGCQIGEGTRIWHLCHVQPGARIGERCVLGQNVSIGNDVVLGDGVKIQNNVSVYTGAVIEDFVFLGPSCVLTNVTNPRSELNRHSLYENPLVRRRASIGATARSCVASRSAATRSSAPGLWSRRTSRTTVSCPVCRAGVLAA